MNTAANIPADRQEFYGRLSPLSLAPLWEVLRGLVPPEPRSKAKAHKWDFASLRPLLLEAGRLLTAEEAERRVLVLENPALAGQSRISSTLYAGFQLVLPGEVAPAHKHTAQAMRFIVEGEGGHTTVAGERTLMQRGDFIVTPNGAWHDHGADGDQPVLWLDILDVAIVNFFEAAFSEELPGGAVQNVQFANGASWNRFGRGMLPIRNEMPYSAATPLLCYPYRESREALIGVSSTSESHPHFGWQLKYANPNDGGWVMPTMSTWLTRLPAGFETRPSRSTVVFLPGAIRSSSAPRIAQHRKSLAYGASPSTEGCFNRSFAAGLSNSDDGAHGS
jgi:gentisate 1,2-dioxygenase